MLKLDTTELYANRPPKHFNNMKVLDLDPLSKAAFPREIEVLAPDGDGARQLAMWHGFPELAVNDFVRCRRDTSDTNILIIEGAGGGTSNDTSQYILVDGTRAFAGNQSLGDNNITNVGDIALDTISSDAGATVTVTLGTVAGDDFIVGNNNAFVVEGDNDRVGIGTASPAATLDVAGAATFNNVITLTGSSFANGPQISNQGDGLLLTTGSTLGVRINNQVNTIELFRVTDGGNVGIGISSPAAQLHIDQSSTTGAKPVITLDQADIDEDYFKFIGTSDTSADRALIDAVDFTTQGAIAGYLKINIQDDQATNPITDGDYVLHFYAAPTA